MKAKLAKTLTWVLMYVLIICGLSVNLLASGGPMPTPPTPSGANRSGINVGIVTN